MFVETYLCMCAVCWHKYLVIENASNISVTHITFIYDYSVSIGMISSSDTPHWPDDQPVFLLNKRSWILFPIPLFSFRSSENTSVNLEHS